MMSIRPVLKIKLLGKATNKSVPFCVNKSVPFFGSLPASKVLLILIKEPRLSEGYFLLTGFPEI